MKNKKNGTKTELATKPITTVTPMPITGFTPFSLMRRFTQDIERMFDDFNGFGLTRPFEPFTLPRFEFPDFAWTPQIEVTESNGHFSVRADLPGMKKDDIDVEVTEEAIVISGERKQESNEEGEGFYRTERSYGSFYRSIPLPEGSDTNLAAATFKDGVLEVSLEVPAREQKGRKLEIAEGTKEKAKAAA